MSARLMMALSFVCGFGPGITEIFLAHLRNIAFAHVHDFAAGARIFLLLDGALVEIVNERGAVMLLDNVGDLAIELMLEREVHAFFHVRDDDERAHGRSEIVVRIAFEVHVLGEVIRLHQFADVVEIRTDTAERSVRADRFGRGFGEIRDDETMMIGARRLDGHAAQKRMIEIGRFQPGNIGGDAEEMFDDGQDAADDGGGDNSVSDGVGALQAEHLPVVGLWSEEIDRTDEAESDREQPERESNTESGADQSTASTHLQSEVNRREPTHQSAGKKRRIEVPKKQSRPKTNEDCCVQTVIPSEQDTQHHRRESIRRDQCRTLRAQRGEGGAVAQNENQFRRRQLHQHRSQNQEQT